MPPLSDDQLRTFAERGSVVVPNVVPRPMVEAAMQRIDRLVERNPPPADRRGFHFYWESNPADTDPLVALLQDSSAWEIIKGLIAPLALAKPEQVQVSLNIPVWNHRPGGPHIDGLTPPEPSGRPGTFTMLAGIFLTDQMATDMGNLWVWPGSHNVAASYLRQPAWARRAVRYRTPDVPDGFARTGLGTGRRPLSRTLLARPQYGWKHFWARPARRLFPSSGGRPSDEMARLCTGSAAGI